MACMVHCVVRCRPASMSMKTALPLAAEQHHLTDLLSTRCNHLLLLQCHLQACDASWRRSALHNSVPSIIVPSLYIPSLYHQLYHHCTAHLAPQCHLLATSWSVSLAHLACTGTFNLPWLPIYNSRLAFFFHIYDAIHALASINAIYRSLHLKWPDMWSGSLSSRYTTDCLTFV
jgi:hypothetical protein